MSNIVYIGTSLDGYIADKDDDLDWLNCVPNPDGDDFGFSEFMSGIDALLMGRKTFEVVLGFDGEWPYSKPVFVLSTTLAAVPDHLVTKAEVIGGAIEGIVSSLHDRGYKNLYIDGGKTIQSFLEQDMVDEMIITRLPILLGGGTPLFGALSGPMAFEHVSTEVLLNAMVKSRYRRKR